MSRLRLGTTHIFECFVQVDGASKRDGVQPRIVKKLPDAYEEGATLAMLPKFCFPCDPEHVEPTEAILPDIEYCSIVWNNGERQTFDRVQRLEKRIDPQKFTFVLTDLEGMHQFGYCRMAVDYSYCLCFLSYLPWTELFYSLLDKIGSLRECGQGALEDPLLLGVYARDLPRPGEAMFIVPKGMESGQTFQLTCPDTTKLPSIPDNWNLTEYHASISAHNVLALFASMLYERRILVTSKRLSLITACVQGAALLLYPLHWQHVFIPVMPAHLTDYCCAPMPFLIGVHSSLMDKVRKMPLDEVVILDADENTVELPAVFNDLQSMPEDVVRTLKHIIKKHTSGIDDIISNAFVLAFAAMIGDYRDFFKRKPDGKIYFDQDGFVESHSRPFFLELLQFQHFQQFVNERLDVLNEGKGINDIFEQAVVESRDEAGKPNISAARRMAAKAAKKMKAYAIPGVKHFMSQAREKTKAGMKALKKKSSKPKEIMYSDSDSDSEKKQQPNGHATGVMFGNRHATVGSSGRVTALQKADDRANSLPVRRQHPPAIPAPYAVYKELKGKEHQRPRSNDLAKTQSTTSIDGATVDTRKRSDASKVKVSSLMSFSPDSSPKIQTKQPQKLRDGIAELLGGFASPSAQAQVIQTGSTGSMRARKSSLTSWEGFAIDSNITGSFSADLMDAFDTQQGNLARKIVVDESSSDELVDTASSSDDEQNAEPPPIPPRPEELDTDSQSGLPPPNYPPPPLEEPNILTFTNPFEIMGMTPSVSTDLSASLLSLQRRQDTPDNEFEHWQSSVTAAYPKQTDICQLSSPRYGHKAMSSSDPFAEQSGLHVQPVAHQLASVSGCDGAGRDWGIVRRDTSRSRRDSQQREYVVGSEIDLDLFDPLKGNH